MTATAEVLGALRNSGLPVTDQAGLAAIAEGEGGISFATLYSGGSLINNADAAHITLIGKTRQWNGGFGPDGFPAWSGATAAGGTLSTAAGPWQDTHTTWRDYAARFGIEDFSPQSQIMFNLSLARSRFPGFSTALANSTPELISAMLVKTWPGGCDSGFAKRYANNLAVLLAPPAPPPEPEHTTVTLSITGQDQRGSPVTFVLKGAAMVALAAVLSGLPACSTHREIPQQIAEKSPAEPVQTGKLDPASMTFTLVPGPLGPLAVPLGR